MKGDTLVANDQQEVTTKRTRPDWVRSTLAVGIGDIIFGVLMLLREADESLSVDQSFGWFFSMVGVGVLVVGGVGCWLFVERGHRRRCWKPPEQRMHDDRSLVRRLSGTLNVPADIWWPASFLQNSLFNVIVTAGFFVWLLFVAPAVAGVFLEALVVGFGLAAVSGAWLLIVLLRR
jgi:hypothetical protein